MKEKHVNTIGKEIAVNFGLVRGPTRYNQTQSNCFNIAANLTRSFGYVPPASLYELVSDIEKARAERLWGIGSKMPNSPANLVIRTPENPTEIHVTFEYKGEEFNYGPSTQDGFPIDLRIPLYRRS